MLKYRVSSKLNSGTEPWVCISLKRHSFSSSCDGASVNVNV